jgi:hypothetical protein
MVDIGISDKFYIDELKKAKELALTPDCRDNCIGCGMKGRIKECGELISDNLK